MLVCTLPWWMRSGAVGGDSQAQEHLPACSVCWPATPFTILNILFWQMPSGRCGALSSLVDTKRFKNPTLDSWDLARHSKSRQQSPGSIAGGRNRGMLQAVAVPQSVEDCAAGTMAVKASRRRRGTFWFEGSRFRRLRAKRRYYLTHPRLAVGESHQLQSYLLSSHRQPQVLAQIPGHHK